MSMEIVFLGTGAGLPSPTRGASCTVFKNGSSTWMFDCGEGSQIQLMKSSVKPGKIKKIFITHLHGDHVFGLPGLMCSIDLLSLKEVKEIPVLHIYGPQGLRDLLYTSLSLSCSEMYYQYQVHEIIPTKECLPEDWKPWMSPLPTDQLHPKELPPTRIECSGDGIWHICKEGNLDVRAGPLKHRIPSFGYVITEEPRPGKLNVPLCKEKGVRPGPFYSQLVSGQSVTLENGTVVHPSEVMGSRRRGRAVVICGDSSDSTGLIKVVGDKKIDVLVHESTMENKAYENAIAYGHSTAGMTGHFARQIKAEHLILTHLSQRFFTKEELTFKSKHSSDTSVEDLVDEARETFGSQNVTAASDFYTYTIPVSTELVDS